MESASIVELTNKISGLNIKRAVTILSLPYIFIQCPIYLEINMPAALIMWYKLKVEPRDINLVSVNMEETNTLEICKLLKTIFSLADTAILQCWIQGRAWNVAIRSSYQEI